VQAILHVRHAPLFALTALVAIAAAWPHTRWAAWLSAKRPDWYDPKANRDIHFVWWVPLGLSAISAALILGEIRVPVIGAGWAKLDAERWPVELEADLRQSIAKDPQARYFNDCEFGGFLIHCGSRGVFVDDRAELYGSEFLEAFANADPATAMPAWQAKYGKFQFALVRPDGSFYDWFAGQGWIVKGRCRAAVWYQAPMIANDSQ
jgi:hypothetical protein